MKDSGTQEAKPAGGPPALGRPWIASGVILLLIAVLYGFCAFGFSRGVAIHGSPANAFYDMDVNRVIGDWTSWAATDRARTHPLYKYIALIGMPINKVFFGGEKPLRAAQIICIAGVLLQLAMLGRLTWILTRNSWAAIAGTVIGAASFCSFLLVSLPDTAALSGIFTLLPLLLAFERRGRPVPWWEITVWVFVGLGSYGITISQLVPFFIGLFYRVRWSPRREGTPAWKRTALPWAAILVAMGLAIWGLLELQVKLFHGTEKQYKIQKILQKEFKYMETDEAGMRPVRRLLKLTTQAALYDFVAPRPAIATWSPPRDERQFLSITLVDEHFTNWRWLQFPFVISQLMLLILWLRRARFRRELTPLGLVLAFNFLMHFAYGREFVIYSLNWHYLLIAALIATLPAKDRTRRWVIAWLLLHGLALALNNAWVIHETFEIYQTDFPIQRAFEIIEPPD